MKSFMNSTVSKTEHKPHPYRSILEELPILDRENIIRYFSMYATWYISKKSGYFFPIKHLALISCSNLDIHKDSLNNLRIYTGI